VCGLRSPEDRKPLRIVLDSDLRLPLSAQLAATGGKDSDACHCGEGAAEERAARLREVQVEVVHVPRNKTGRVDLTEGIKTSPVSMV